MTCLNSNNKKLSGNIAILGAGNGGQTMSAHLSWMGFHVRLYDKDSHRIHKLKERERIELTGALNLEANVALITDNLDETIKDAELIMITTTANAHRPLAKELAKLLTDGQIIILNPGRTGGALEFRNTLIEEGLKSRVYIAEAQTLIYACRVIEEGKVNVIGVKDRVLISAYPASDTSHILNYISKIFPCFYPASNVLQTSFENIGAIFHPCVVLFNEAAIERGEQFYFYRDMTAGLSRLIEAADQERLKIAREFGINPISAFDWVSYAYNGVEGNTLCERMKNNPAYYEILSPPSIECRQLTEDIPMGIIPMVELGKSARVETPVLSSLIIMASVLLKRDFNKEGRTLDRLGLSGMTTNEIIKKIL